MWSNFLCYAVSKESVAFLLQNLEMSNEQPNNVVSLQWYSRASPPVSYSVKSPNIQLPASSCISRYHMMKPRGKESIAFLIQNLQTSNDQPSNVISLQWFSHPYPPVSRYAKWPKILLPTYFCISSYHISYYISCVFPYQGINCLTTFCLSICQMTKHPVLFLGKVLTRLPLQHFATLNEN